MVLFLQRTTLLSPYLQKMLQADLYSFYSFFLPLPHSGSTVGRKDTVQPVGRFFMRFLTSLRNAPDCTNSNPHSLMFFCKKFPLRTHQRLLSPFCPSLYTFSFHMQVEAYSSISNALHLNDPVLFDSQLT